ncbi:MAG: GNAT family N-acetyltransferase [Pseudomonas sp.]|nr:MAG: GNAT family N-acetyltransferase [Pseudomonas sp.]
MKADYKLAIKNHQIDLLEIEDRLVALIEMIPETEWLLIENLAVAPNFQCSGYASALIKRAQDTAKELHIRGLRLFTNKMFNSNVDFYVRQGFTVDYEEPFMGGITVYMIKSL